MYINDIRDIIKSYNLVNYNPPNKSQSRYYCKIELTPISILKIDLIENNNFRMYLIFMQKLFFVQKNIEYFLINKYLVYNCLLKNIEDGYNIDAFIPSLFFNDLPLRSFIRKNKKELAFKSKFI